MLNQQIGFVIYCYGRYDEMWTGMIVVHCVRWMSFAFVEMYA